MPLIKHPKQERVAEASELKEIIVHEWKNPTTEPDKPVIVIDEDAGRFGATHVTVIWDQWQGMTQRERAGIVMDACEEVLSNEELRDVTLAMGLTKDEADRMHIQYHEGARV